MITIIAMALNSYAAGDSFRQGDYAWGAVHAVLALAMVALYISDLVKSHRK